MYEIDFDIDESYSASDGYRHLVVLDPRTTPPVVTVRTQYGRDTTIDVWRGHVIPLGFIPNNCADTSRIVAVLTRRAPDLIRLAGTEEEIDWRQSIEQEISDEIDEAARAAPTYWEAAVYFERSDWSEIDPRTGTLDLDRLTDRIVAQARVDEVYLEAADVTDYLRARLAREVEQSYDDALEEDGDGGVTLVRFKAAAQKYCVHQRGPDDTSGWERDREWREALARARTWDAVQDALPARHPLAAVAANDGKYP